MSLPSPNIPTAEDEETDGATTEVILKAWKG